VRLPASGEVYSGNHLCKNGMAGRKVEKLKPKPKEKEKETETEREKAREREKEREREREKEREREREEAKEKAKEKAKERAKEKEKESQELLSRAESSAGFKGAANVEDDSDFFCRMCCHRVERKQQMGAHTQ
jgi:hypothetical protein